MKKLKVIGNIITVLAILFIIKKIFSLDLNVNIIFKGSNGVILGVCTLVYTIQLLLLCIPWINLVSIFTDGKVYQLKVPGLFSYLYTKSNILKYVPGNVFQYVGRNELAVRLQLSHVEVASATLVEIVLTLLSAFFISAVCIWAYTKQFILLYQEQFVWVLFVGALLFCMISIVFIKFYRDKVSLYYKKYRGLIKRRTAIVKVFFSFLFYAVNFLVNAALFLVILYLCGVYQLSFDAVRTLIGAFILSWAVGYVTPGSPGGIGVREVIMTAVIAGSGIASEDMIMLAMLFYRGVNIVGDIAAFILSFMFFHYKRKEEI
ncbi:MAG: flippase-like domain-containing protein [Clostridiales bacterium]|nr:flippase-like domain-containing protein [Clostridiales bacterium]